MNKIFKPELIIGIYLGFGFGLIVTAILLWSFFFYDIAWLGNQSSTDFFGLISSLISIFCGAILAAEGFIRLDRLCTKSHFFRLLLEHLAVLFQKSIIVCCSKHIMWRGVQHAQITKKNRLLSYNGWLFYRRNGDLLEFLTTRWGYECAK